MSLPPSLWFELVVLALLVHELVTLRRSGREETPASPPPAAEVPAPPAEDRG